MLLKNKFLNRSVLDIRPECQKMVAEANKTLDNLVSEATKIYYHQEQVINKKREKECYERMAALQGTLVTGQREGGEKLVYFHNQKLGYFKRLCPQRSRSPPGPYPICKVDHWEKLLFPGRIGPIINQCWPPGHNLQVPHLFGYNSRSPRRHL